MEDEHHVYIAFINVNFESIARRHSDVVLCIHCTTYCMGDEMLAECMVKVAEHKYVHM